MTTIDDYYETIDPSQKAEIERVMGIVRKAVPEAEQLISYNLPAFKYKGKPLIYFGAFKDHYSVFPTSKPVAALAEKLSRYKISKGTIQYTADNPITEELLLEIVDQRLKDI
jgi:uncharacterized protein YdhG (YjbR/CyaY superfamily)